MANPTAKASKVINYIIQCHPETLETKNSDGDTPLMVASYFGRTDFVRLLIAAGADQSTRNKSGNNLVHYAISGLPRAEQLEPFLWLLDKDLLHHLFITRTNLHGTGMTPLHAFVDATAPSGSYARRNAYKTETEWLAVLKLLLKFSTGAELEMLDGAGDTLLHKAVMQSSAPLAQALLDFNPSLLYRENAVGCTPAEVARHRVTTERFKAPSVPSVPNNTRKSVSALVDRPPGEFVAKPEAAESTKSDAEKVWDMCVEYMDKYPGKRRLVSLNEANDVAKRLGEQYSASRYFGIQARGDDDDEEEDEEGEGKASEVADFSVQSRKGRDGCRWLCERCLKRGTNCCCREEREGS